MTHHLSAPGTPLSVAARIAEWAAGLDVADVPATVRRAVANTVIDTAALGIASFDTDYGRAVRGMPASAGPCTVFGGTATLDPYAAALINGTMAHGEDYDNTYEGCPVHSGVVIVPALLAAGEAHGLPADRVALGMAVGIELMCRLGMVAQKAVHTAGFHPTSVLGTPAAAAGVAVAMGLDAGRIGDALGVAGSLSSGIIEYLADGSWTKRLHAGWAAQSGIRAAELGAHGFRGPATVFEGVHGLYKAFAPGLNPDFDLLLAGLGTHWEAANVAFKPYACGTMTQPYIDCAVNLRRHGIAPGDIVDITCAVGEGTVHRLWAPLELKQRPPTPYAAKFSGPFCVAVGVLRGDAGLSEFTEATITDPHVLALAAKVRFEVDPDNPYPRAYTGELKVTLRDGRTIIESQPHLRGGVDQPMSRDDLVAKARANLAFGHWHGDAANLITLAEGMFDDPRTLSANLLSGTLSSQRE
ncbi:MmgE/PrpD family protein [Pinirhizobacter sp.]|jgi:2-methylcitrate dehydratase PrpD|uniref:MmgE/PrpD family protein n=1 Tax=Pinirhizobacter sp. TaxID=2950432 RepID=UPI002F42384A